MTAPGREFLDLLSATVALGAFRSVLAGIVALADEAAKLSDEQLRGALMALGRSSRRLADGEAVRAHWAVGDPPGVLRARSGAVLSSVAARFSDRPCGSLVCPACTERTAGSGLSAGWPLVEVAPTPGGQPLPSPARQDAAEALAVPPAAVSPSWSPSTAPHKLDFFLRRPIGCAMVPQLPARSPVPVPLLSGDPAPGER